jgi:predicted lipoprotein
MLAWEALGAVAIGPLLERHSEANIDFTPTRSYMVEGAVEQALSDTTTLRRTGVAGRGLPAMEWLLWTPAAAPLVMADPRACNYTLLLAQDVVEEAQALQARFGELAQAVPDHGTAAQSSAELVNQLVGAVEVLRRKRLFNPVVISNPKTFARALSGEAQRAWTVRWQSIQHLLITEQREGPATIWQLVHDQDLLTTADSLQTAVAGVTSALEKASPGELESVRRAADALLSLRRTLQEDVAPSLQIPTSFSDSDGD